MPGIRPGVGFSPAIPQKCAGMRMEPPPSLATPPAEHNAAIAAASPPLDPPGVRVKSQGLLVRPVIGRCPCRIASAFPAYWCAPTRSPPPRAGAPPP